MSGKAHILVVDDDDLLRESIRVRLEQDGFWVSVAATGKTALSAASRNPPDLVILDVGLTDSDGLDICRALQREHPAVRVIFLTGRSSEIDKVSGLALGDDYVTKPFSMIELEARIGTVLRRTREASRHLQTSVIEMGEIRLEPASRRMMVRGQLIELSLKEFDLLHLLMSHAGEVLTTNEILSAVWGPEYLGAHELVYVHVSWLRQKLGDDPRHPKLLHTVRGVGYRFMPEEES
jgi:two-component system phosphate regulon response regulator PhoB